MCAKGDAGCIELSEQRGDHPVPGAGQASRWLVQEEQAWATGQGESDLHPALLPVGEIAHHRRLLTSQAHAPRLLTAGL